MTMNENAMRRLEARGLDVELADRLGFGSERRVVGERPNRVEVDTLVIPFRRNGEVVRRKYKVWDVPEGAPAYQQDKGGVRCAWNEDCLRDPKLHGETLIITEGELDAFAAIQCGYERTISVPDGAPKESLAAKGEALEDQRKYAWLMELKPLLSLENVPEIILATDGDGPGAALLQDLATMLGRYRCKFIAYPKANDRVREHLGRDRLKDLNEVLKYYGARGVAEVIGRAEFMRIEGVFRMSELPPVPDMPLYEIPGLPLYGEHFKLRLGDWSVITGIPGHGKTAFANDLLCRCAFQYGLRIAWGSWEQRPQTDHRRNLRRWYIGHLRWHVSAADVPPGVILGGAGAPWTESERRAADAWIDEYHRFIYPSEDDDVTLDWFLEKSEGAVAQQRCKVVVADPWNEMDHSYDGRSETEAQYINRAIKEMRRFGRAFGAHMMVVAHPTKMPSDNGIIRMPGLYDINGGAVWFNKADLGVVVYREGESEVRIKTAKSKYHDVIGKPGSVIMELCKEDLHYREIRSGAAGQVAGT